MITHPPWRSRIGASLKRLGRAVGWGLVIVTMGLALGYGGLHTDAGRVWLERQVARISQGRLEIRGLSGILHREIRAESVTWRQPGAMPRLDGHDCRLQWHWPSLGRGWGVVKRLRVNTLAITPDPAADLPPRATRPPRARDPWIHGARIEHFEIGALKIDGFARMPALEGHIQGGLEWRHGGSARLHSQAALRLGVDAIPLMVSGACGVESGRIQIESLNISNAWDHVSLTGHYQFPDGARQGHLRVHISDLARYAGLLGSPMQGALTGHGALASDSAAEPPTYTFEFTSQAPAWGSLAADTLSGAGSFAWATGVPTGAFEIQGQGLRGDHWHMRTASLEGVSPGATNTLPQGTLMLSLDGLQSELPLLTPMGDANLAMQINIAPSNVQWHGHLQHPSLIKAQFNGHIPRHLPDDPDDRRSPWSGFDLPGMSAGLSIQANLKSLGDAVPTEASLLGGLLDLDLQVSRLFDQPVIRGHLDWRDGEYRNIRTGTYLNRIDVHLVGDDHRLVVATATAEDGGRGTLTADGAILIESGGIPSWDLTLSLDRASLFRVVRSEVPLTGTLQAIGTTTNARLEGDLWLEPTRVVIPRRLPPSIPDYPVTEVNRPATLAPMSAADTIPIHPSDPAPTRSTPAPVLDIRMRTRGDMTVTGRGIQTGWQGLVRLKGDTDQPVIEGVLSVTEGYAMLLGRRFRVDHGEILLDGALPPNPRLLVSASCQIADITARLVVSGNVSRPDIALVSDPSLPEEEIMARILFGKALDAISPWQALALANGLNTLRGGEDLVTVIDNSQRLVKIDRFEVRQDEDGDGLSSVAVGKYLGSRFYLEGVKGIGEAADSVTVTMELTPSLVLETETSPRIREGLGIHWRREY